MVLIRIFKNPQRVSAKCQAGCQFEEVPPDFVGDEEACALIGVSAPQQCKILRLKEMHRSCHFNPFQDSTLRTLHPHKTVHYRWSTAYFQRANHWNRAFERLYTSSEQMSKFIYKIHYYMCFVFFPDCVCMPLHVSKGTHHSFWPSSDLPLSHCTVWATPPTTSEWPTKSLVVWCCKRTCNLLYIIAWFLRGPCLQLQQDFILCTGANAPCLNHSVLRPLAILFNQPRSNLL